MLGAAISIFISVVTLSVVRRGFFPDIDTVFGQIAYYNSVRYFAFFYITSAYSFEIMQYITVRLGRLAVLSCSIFLLSAALLMKIDYPIRSVVVFVSSVSGVTAALILSQVACRIGLFTRAICVLGRNTLPIYVAQVPLIGACVAVIPLMPHINASLEPFLPVIMTPIIIYFSLLVYRFANYSGAQWLYRLPKVEFEWIRLKYST
jgi:hypothetical protein